MIRLFVDMFVLQVKERIPKMSKKLLLMAATCPAPTQDEETEVTVKKTPEPEGRDDTFQEDTEHFFVTQVCIRPVSVIFILLLLVGKYEF